MLTTIFVLLSCNNEENSNEFITDAYNASILSKAQIETASMEEKIKYKRHHMKTLASFIIKRQKSLLNLMQSKNVASKDKLQIFSIEKLVDDLILNKNSNNLEISESELNKVNNSINSFKELEGDNWFPIVYFRNPNSTIKSATENENERTFVAIEDSDGTDEFFTAYELLDNDYGDEELVLLDIELTPDYVANNSLMVVELASCNDADLPQFYEGVACGDTNAGGGNTGGGNTGGGTSSQNLVLEKMTIKDLKEGWPGRSEISFKGYKVNNINEIAYDCNLSISSSVNCWTWEGNRITRLKRRYKNDERVYDWIIKTNNNNINDVIYYVIFEEDSFPANERYAYFTFPNGLTSRIPYRSWQGNYDRQTLSQNFNNPFGFPYANNFSIDKETIKYNLKLK